MASYLIFLLLFSCIVSVLDVDFFCFIFRGNCVTGIFGKVFLFLKFCYFKIEI